MPKIVDHEARRREILCHCFQLFTTRGYAALTMREIACALNVSTGTLYHYFRSKSQLFEAMFEQLCERHINKVRDQLGSSKNRRERFAALGQFFIETSADLQQTIKLTLDFQRQMTIEARAGRSENPSFLSRLTRAYQNALEEQLGLRRAGLAAGIFSFFLGILLHRELAPTEIELREQLSCLDAFLALELLEEG